MTVSLKDSAILLRIVHSAWLDSLKQLMARLLSLRVSDISAAVPTFFL